jgi:lysozyme family protein
MQHPYLALAPEYENLLRSVAITRPAEVKAVALRLLGFKARYGAVSLATTVPIVVLATLHERESSADFRTNLAQGDPLTRPSVHVPAGRPPLRPGMSFPVTWEYAAVDAITYDRLNENSAPWTMSYACWKGEAWNGFGPRAHGIHTGYLWGGTNHYTRGKYIRDGVWDADHVDTQLGIVPIILAMAALDPSAALPLSAAPAVTIAPPLPAPIGVGGGPHDAAWIQRRLNALGFGPLLEDGSYGRFTRNAVRAFQAKHGLEVDGLVGPKTDAALAAATPGRL